MKINDIDSEWITQHLCSIRQRAGRRYTPKLNVDLPIVTNYEALSRGFTFYSNVRKHYGSLRHFFNDLYYHREKSKFITKYDDLKNSYTKLEEHLKDIKEYETNAIPWDQIYKECKDLEEIYYDLVDKLHEYKSTIPESNRDEEQAVSGEINDVYRLTREVRFFINYSNSDEARLSNEQVVLIKGQAGIGKTHSLCDLISGCKDRGLIAILVFGEIFDITKDFYRQVCKQLDVDSNISKEEFLSALDHIGETQKTKVILAVDAINETPLVKYWKKWLPQVLTDLKPYKNISLVLSIRSGYETLCISKDLLEKLTVVEHEGFSYREWDAVKKFFKEFNIELPKIPLLQPEFRVPLFLLLFCESVSARSKKDGKKQAYKGHEGATYIFEQFVKEISKKIAKKFHYSSPNAVYEKVIKSIAEGMVIGSKFKDRLSEKQLKLLLKKNSQNIDINDLVSSLQSAHLLIKIPSYSGNNKVKFYYKFSYQKFSDHLITRYLINKYVPVINIKSPAFRKKGVIGKLIAEPWNTGLIEALSIQLPERGIELFEVCPWAQNISYVSHAFIESLVWRDPKRFKMDKNKPTVCINYINTVIMGDSELFNGLLSALFTISSVAEHPLNGLVLNDFLNKQSMANRDGFLSEYVRRNYEQNSAIDRLLEWSWTSDLIDVLSDASVKLTAIPLTWLLSSSNRKLRDRSTKALVNLMCNRPKVLLDIWKLFLDVNDPYVTERVYAVIYGSLLRQKHINNRYWKMLVLSIYNYNYVNTNLPASIMTRSYIKAIVDQYTARRKCEVIDCEKVVLNKPMGKVIRAPSERRTREHYFPAEFSWDKATPADRGVVAIFNSMGDLDDFCKVTVKHAISKWMRYKKSESVPKTQEDLKQDFILGLSKPQKDLYDLLAYNISNYVPIIVRYNNSPHTPEEKKMLREEQQLYRSLSMQLLSSLNAEQQTLYKKLFGRSRRTIYNNLGFRENLAKNWILNRVFSLGYSASFHGSFDASFDTMSEYTGKSYFDRIGKKYQWIALFELLGHLADTYQYQKDRYSRTSESSEFGYSDFLDLGLRDIDPSCILKHPYSNGKILKWFDKLYDINKSIPENSWYEDHKQIPNLRNVLEISLGKEKWLNLNAACTWMQAVPPEDEEDKWNVPRRELYYLISSFIIRTKQLDKFVSWGNQQNFFGRWMPEAITYRDFYLREYPGSIVFKSEVAHWKDNDDFIKVSHRSNKNLPTSMAITSSEVTTTMGSHDKTFEDNLTLYVPSKWLIKKLELTQRELDGVFVNKAGIAVCQDFVLTGNQPGALIANKLYLLDWLNKQGYSLVWTIIGEKRHLYGMSRRDEEEKHIPIILSGCYSLSPTGEIYGSVNQRLDRGA